jgi:sugar/nucleoside kinase (ribokinase family)
MRLAFVRRIGQASPGARLQPDRRLQSGVPTPQLLCAGEAFDDLVFVGLERLPAPGEEVRTQRFLATIGGGAVITAVAAARLGVDVALASGLSDAAAARLRSERIRVTNVRKRGEPHAITAALSTSTERAFVTFDGVNTRLERRLIPVLHSTRARHVHLALFPRDARFWAGQVTQLCTRKITTSWDFGWNDTLARDPGLPALIDALDLMFVNESEAALYAGADNLEAALPFWRARKSIVVIKLGAAGSRAVGPGGEWSAPAARVATVDTTGAGDAFNGGFLAVWLETSSLSRSLAAGNRIGAASTRKAGGIEALPRRRRS